MSDHDDEIECLSPIKSPKRKTEVLDESIDDEEDCNNEVPDGAECLSRCKKFAEITGTDTALAMFYLQDTNWNLEKGLNSYYRSIKSTNSKVVACFDVDTLNEDEKRNSKNFKNKRSKSPDQIVTVDSSDENEETDKSLSKSNDSSIIEQVYNQKDVEEDEESEIEDNFFKILSWNIDGLDKQNLESRTIGVVKKILDQSPDVVLLQEVVNESETILKNSLKNIYHFSSGNDSLPVNKFVIDKIEYYTLILIKIKTCQFKSNQITWFNNSVMGRNLLKVKLSYKKKVNLCVMTAHLESTAEFSKQRIEQLQTCFNQMLEQEANSLVFFGGDLNLRDSELKAIGGTPGKIHDIWESTGSRKECLYTWDCSRNTNLKMNSKFKPKCRFDRLFYRPILSNNSREVISSSSSEPCFTLMPVYFELEGLEKLKSCGRFCSDHWAIQSYCQIEQFKV